MEESLPFCQACHQLVWWGRDVGGVVEGASRRADPVLTAAELSRRGHVAPHALHELLVQLPDQTKGQGQRAEPLHTVFFVKTPRQPGARWG